MTKKTFVLTCVILFVSSLAVIAQQNPERSVLTETSDETMLHDPNIEKYSEKELLELKIKFYKAILAQRLNHHEAGTKEGRAGLVAGAKADLTNAEAELYRHTGDKEKLLAALKTKVAACQERLRSEEVAYEGYAGTTFAVWTAKIQLLDALLELKQETEKLLPLKIGE